MSILDTGVRNVRNVTNYMIGVGVSSCLSDLVRRKKKEFQGEFAVYFIDEFFESNLGCLEHLKIADEDQIIYIQTQKELTTTYVDAVVRSIVGAHRVPPCLVVGIGGGTTLDMAKAVSNLLTNEGCAENYQGWDLVKVPGVYKIGVPTISGTGSEATRTCVMVNEKSGLKLGMNSDFTVFDQILMDPTFSKTVPRNQYFYTGMDAYIHCLESINGRYRNTVGDSYSKLAMDICRDVFLGGDMMSDSARERLMVASYVGGCAIASSYVGLVHPLSAGLSVVLGLHHCVANCIVMRAMQDFYPQHYVEFWEMVARQKVEIPAGVCKNLSEDKFQLLFNATLMHEKPLFNALGDDYKNILSKSVVTELFRRM